MPNTLSLENKHILVTGASGFIGRHLTLRLLREGGILYGAGRSLPPEEEQLPGVTYLTIDYSSEESVYESIQETLPDQGYWDIVVHNAGVTKATDPDLYYIANGIQTGYVVQALLRLAQLPQRFLYMSSLAVYGPLSYGFTAFCEEHPYTPNTHYGKSKVVAEDIIKTSGIPYTIMQPTGVYGPGEQDYKMQIDAVKRFHIYNSVGFKPQELSFIYVDDLVEACALALKSSQAVNQCYALSEDRTYTNEEFLDAIAKAHGMKRPPLHIRVPLAILKAICGLAEDIGHLTGKAPTLNRDKYKIMSGRNWTCAIEKAQEDLGWTPQVNLYDGIKRTVIANQ